MWTWSCVRSSSSRTSSAASNRLRRRGSPRNLMVRLVGPCVQPYAPSSFSSLLDACFTQSCYGCHLLFSELRKHVNRISHGRFDLSLAMAVLLQWPSCWQPLSASRRPSRGWLTSQPCSCMSAPSSRYDLPSTFYPTYAYVYHFTAVHFYATDLPALLASEAQVPFR